MFPRTFFIYEKKRRPLKDGIDIDLVPVVEDTISGPELRRAIEHYCGNVAYLRGLIQGAVKIDLEGRPAGSVSVDEEVAAKEWLARREQQTKADRKAIPSLNVPERASEPQPTSPTAERSPSPSSQGLKRLGLADLKSAWQQRQAAKQAAE
jgi:sRNA-binding protein